MTTASSLPSLDCPHRGSLHLMAQRSLDQVLADLQHTRAALEDCSEADRRASLGETLARLRAEARQITGEPMEQLSDEMLTQQITRCEERLDTLADRRLNIGQVGGASGVGGGLDPLQTIEHNAMVDKQEGRAEIESELAALRRELRRRRET